MSNANLCQNILRVFLQGIARGILDVLQNVVSKLFSLLRNSFRLYPWSHIFLISLDAASTKYSLLVQRYAKRHSWLCRTAYLQLVETVVSIWGNFLYGKDHNNQQCINGSIDTVPVVTDTVVITIHRTRGPDCPVMCNLINTHTHIHTHAINGMTVSDCAVMLLLSFISHYLIRFESISHHPAEVTR